MGIHTQEAIGLLGNETMDELQSNFETLQLLSIPGMRESIREGLDQDLSECIKELDW